MSASRCSFVALVVALAFCSQGRLTAQEAQAKSNDVTKAFFEKHCQACHAGKEPKGDFRVASLTADFLNKPNRDQWLAVLEHLTAATMPPKEKARPAASDVAVVSDWIRRQAAAAQALEGRVVLRRLNRTEYQNT